MLALGEASKLLQIKVADPFQQGLWLQIEKLHAVISVHGVIISET